MTGKEWRKQAEFIVGLIDNALDYKVKTPEITEDMTVGEYKYRCELARRCTAEAQLYVIKKNIEWFKEAYLDREHADDFDEYEEGAIS